MPATAADRTAYHQWASDAGLSDSEIARQIGVAPFTAGRYRDGSRTARPEIARRLFLVSGGKVDANGMVRLPSLAQFGERLAARGVAEATIRSVFVELLAEVERESAAAGQDGG
ncbi:MAG: hypothetical protein WD100_09740 [Tistlia sp.]|uniref:hypothetical protein n=1 Tax=Tistlia sp. TaxID=3057121 RepID=UPI0034A348E2